MRQSRCETGTQKITLAGTCVVLTSFGHEADGELQGGEKNDDGLLAPA